MSKDKLPLYWVAIHTMKAYQSANLTQYKRRQKKEQLDAEREKASSSYKAHDKPEEGGNVR